MRLEALGPALPGPGLSVHVVSFLTPFLVTRFGAALVLARKYDEAQRVLTALVRPGPQR